jgi:hypothetical protein
LHLSQSPPQATITNLQMTLSTKNMDFDFTCDGAVQMLGQTVEMGIDLGRTHDDSNNTNNTFAGYLTIDGQTFTADFTSAKAGKTVKFEWKDTGEGLGFEAIASFFGWKQHADVAGEPRSRAG